MESCVCDGRQGLVSPVLPEQQAYLLSDTGQASFGADDARSGLATSAKAEFHPKSRGVLSDGNK